MVDSVSGVSTINIRKPQEYEHYKYEVEINGKKQMAEVERTPNGKVTIKVSDGKDTKTIVTNTDGLLEFNKNYMPKDDLYKNVQTEEKPENQKVYSGPLAQIMRNIALAGMRLGAAGLSNNSTDEALNQQMLINQQNQILQDQMFQNQLIQQQQMINDQINTMQQTTPGMGII